MCTIEFSHDYLTAQELMLSENSFMEEVIAEIKEHDYLFTCSLGLNKNQPYISWNLIYHDELFDVKEFTITEEHFNIFDKHQLQNEMLYKLRQMLLKNANRLGNVFQASRLLQSVS